MMTPGRLCEGKTSTHVADLSALHASSGFWGLRGNQQRATIAWSLGLGLFVEVQCDKTGYACDCAVHLLRSLQSGHHSMTKSMYVSVKTYVGEQEGI